jgi:hypothetical protein
MLSSEIDERMMTGTVAALVTRTAAPEHVSSSNCRRPAKHSRTPALQSGRPLQTGAAAMITAAIYARRSTDQTGIADDAKSVTRQIEHAKTYAARKGWMVRDEHVYKDDGISGAEFKNRPRFDDSWHR